MSSSRRGAALNVWVALGTVYVVWGSTYLAIAIAVETQTRNRGLGQRPAGAFTEHDDLRHEIGSGLVIRFARTVAGHAFVADSHADDARLTRFANSEIHQNVAESDAQLNLRFVVGRRVGVVAGTGVLLRADCPWPAHADAVGALVEFAGRACYQSCTQPMPATATNAGYLRHILEVGHLSVHEHGSGTLYGTRVGR